MSYAALVAGAWLALGFVQRSELSWFFSHEVLGARGLAPPLAVAGFTAGWLLMLVAMMVPAALPELLRARRRPGAHGSTWLAGNLAPWLLFGFAFAAADLIVHTVIEPRHPYLVARAPTLLWLLAGGHLLVRIARAVGRAPFGHGHTAHGRSRAAAFLAGWGVGISCLREGWTLMLAVAGSCHDSILLMAAATLLMSAPAYVTLTDLKRVYTLIACHRLSRVSPRRKAATAWRRGDGLAPSHGSTRRR